MTDDNICVGPQKNIQKNQSSCLFSYLKVQQMKYR